MTKCNPVALLACAAALPLASAAFLRAPITSGATPSLVRRASTLCMAKGPALTDASGAEIKPALSAYVLFCTDRRPALSSQLKASAGAAFNQPMVLTALGAEWNALSDGEKAEYKVAAVADKARYDAAVSSNPANAEKMKKFKRKSPRRTGGPKKLSAYMHFCAERRPSLVHELKTSMGTDFSQPAVMSALGAEWRAMDGARKARFEAMVQATAAPVEPKAQFEASPVKPKAKPVQPKAKPITPTAQFEAKPVQPKAKPITPTAQFEAAPSKPPAEALSSNLKARFEAATSTPPSEEPTEGEGEKSLFDKVIEALPKAIPKEIGEIGRQMFK